MVERIVQNDPTLLSTFMSLRRNVGMTPPYLYPTTHNSAMPLHHQMSNFDYAHSHQNPSGLPPRSTPSVQLNQQQRSASSTPTSFTTHMNNAFMPTSVMRQMYRDP